MLHSKRSASIKENLSNLQVAADSTLYVANQVKDISPLLTQYPALGPCLLSNCMGLNLDDLYCFSYQPQHRIDPLLDSRGLVSPHPDHTFVNSLNADSHQHRPFHSPSVVLSRISHAKPSILRRKSWARGATPCARGLLPTIHDGSSHHDDDSNSSNSPVAVVSPLQQKVLAAAERFGADVVDNTSSASRGLRHAATDDNVAAVPQTPISLGLPIRDRRSSLPTGPSFGSLRDDDSDEPRTDDARALERISDLSSNNPIKRPNFRRCPVPRSVAEFPGQLPLGAGPGGSLHTVSFVLPTEDRRDPSDRSTSSRTSDGDSGSSPTASTSPTQPSTAADAPFKTSHALHQYGGEQVPSSLDFSSDHFVGLFSREARQLKGHEWPSIPALNEQMAHVILHSCPTVAYLGSCKHERLTACSTRRREDEGCSGDEDMCGIARAPSPSPESDAVQPLCLDQRWFCRWVLVRKQRISDSATNPTYLFRFASVHATRSLQIAVGQHVCVRLWSRHQHKWVERYYTPIFSCCPTLACSTSPLVRRHVGAADAPQSPPSPPAELPLGGSVPVGLEIGSSDQSSVRRPLLSSATCDATPASTSGNTTWSHCDIHGCESNSSRETGDMAEAPADGGEGVEEELQPPDADAAADHHSKMRSRSHSAPLGVTATMSPGQLELMVKIFPDGEMTSQLQQLVPGDSVQIKGPFGIDLMANPLEQPWRRVLLVGGGVGITPLLQILQHAFTHWHLPTRDPSQPPSAPPSLPRDCPAILFVQIEDTEGDVALQDELDHLAKVHPTFMVQRHVLQPSGDGEGSGRSGGSGSTDAKKNPLTKAIFDGYLQRLWSVVGGEGMRGARDRAFICGPCPFQKYIVSLMDPDVISPKCIFTI
ncbi:unnamed protein product [Vitrella brassicaformis CCMP3155]|uniref:FAD-binding FR-type domain-containing protein n=1 Tax=Vitrella brassicaformis (strain CCMP3155) TaxID=1169540 RepID=A0A0G4EGC1_VITBC|nr:unnamed protein product [Vitrella brassicaformis CCMP3155]|mmetsp:Transcript_38401/g.96198  ORF Transcript_38401/g.96198 Transcript_38401/m.96198 type:complete len:877 (-) Transcript_38401:569-3199(-)|eukprot:CEL94508.1 unnamed protein product [Vitrella brassicaformis CCMP3155]